MELPKANSYSKVLSPSKCWILRGHKPSNAYYGASQLYEPIFEEIPILVGDEIHNLCGGVFLVRNGICVGEIRGTTYEFAPFCHNVNCRSEIFNDDLKIKAIEHPAPNIKYRN